MRRSWFRLLLRAGFAFTFLLCAGIGLAAFRLLLGPIPLTPAKSYIESAVSAELGGHAFKFRDAELTIGHDGLEISLLDIRITDPNGAVLVQAPRAVVGLSSTALLSAKLGLSRVDLISPRMQFNHSDDGSFSVRFAQPAEATAAPERSGAAGATPSAAAVNGSSQIIDGAGEIDIIKAITDISAQARRRQHVTAFLKEVGLKQATVLVDNGRRKTIWQIPEIKLDLSHKASRSLISGRIVVDSLTGPWSIDFHALEAAAAQQLSIQAKVAGVNPRGLSRLVPSMAPFEKIDVPLDGEAQIELSSRGQIISSTFALDARVGQILASLGHHRSVSVEACTIKGRYDRATNNFTIAEASLGIDHHRLDLVGDITRSPTPASDGLPLWNYQFASNRGTLAAATPGGAPVPVEKFMVRGQIVPEAGRLLMQELSLNAGGASIAAKGSISDLTTEASRAAGLEGRIAPMPVSSLFPLWPSTIAPEARSWLASHVTKGQLTAGNFKLASGPDSRTSMTLEISNAEIVHSRAMPALEIPRALVRLEGSALEVTIPDAAIGSDVRRLAFKGVRVTAVESADGAPPLGEIAFRVFGPLAGVVDLVDREPFKLLKSKGITLQSPEGKLDGQFKVTLPFSETADAGDIRTEGRLRLTDGRVRQAIGGHDITGAKIDIDISPTAIDARGDLLVKGIAVKILGQYFLNTTPDRQSAFRLVTKLDDADRNQLGLGINDLISGEVPIEITLQPDAKGDYQAHLLADLTKAELTLDSVAYRKPAGTQARVQFDPVKGTQGKIELQNFKIVGDSIAAEGAIVLGPDGKARELSFPDFSLNLVSRLDVQGRLRPDRVWEVRAKGASFDGRELFRDLLNVQGGNKLVPRDKPGLDLFAEIDTVIGFSDTKLKNVRLSMQKRSDNGIEKTTSLQVNAQHETGKSFEAQIRAAPVGERKLIAQSQDAGQTFKTVGFYPNAVGGTMNLEVALDVHGAVERNGVLRAENFAVLGDLVVSEVVQNRDGSVSTTQGKKTARERFEFTQMTLPFSVGSGQFVMNDVQLRGPIIGAVLRGKADFKLQRLQIGGTYVPLSGLNSAIGGIPILGQILAGPKGEGVFGITFAIQGPMSAPEVLINPLSTFIPGILRETQQMTPDRYKITPRDEPSSAGQRSDASRASSAAPTGSGRLPNATTPRSQSPDVLSDWASDAKLDSQTDAPSEARARSKQPAP